MIKYLVERRLVDRLDKREWGAGGLVKLQRLAGLISILVVCRSWETGVVRYLAWRPDSIGMKGGRRLKASKEVW